MGAQRSPVSLANSVSLGVRTATLRRSSSLIGASMPPQSITTLTPASVATCANSCNSVPHEHPEIWTSFQCQVNTSVPSQHLVAEACQNTCQQTYLGCQGVHLLWNLSLKQESSSRL